MLSIKMSRKCSVVLFDIDKLQILFNSIGVSILALGAVITGFFDTAVTLATSAVTLARCALMIFADIVSHLVT